MKDGKFAHLERVVKKAEKTVDQAAKTDMGRRYGQAFGPNCPVRLIVCVLLFGSFLGGLLIRTNGALASGEHHTMALACWFLVALGIAGTALAGHGISWGWLILFGLQPLWIAYALVTGQHGFIPGALAHGVAQLYGFVRSTPSAQRTASGSKQERAPRPKKDRRR